MRQINFIFLCCLLLVVCLQFAYAEEITLTTYYPAPYGNYKELRANQLSIGSGYRQQGLSDGNLLVEGSVGIGTTSVGGKLEIHNSAGGDKNFIFDTVSYDGDAGTISTSTNLDLYFDSDSNGFGFFSIKAGDPLSTSHTELLRVQPNGNVGIGTENPGAKLEVVGDINAESNSWGSASDVSGGCNDGGAGFAATCPAGTYMVGISVMTNVITLRCRRL